MNSVPVVFICDNNFVMQTSVAITSLILNKKPNTCYDIFVLAVHVSENKIKKIQTLQKETCNINIIKISLDDLAGLHNYRENAYCVATEAALLKFKIADLFPKKDKILYLDGDIVVRADLSELYDTDIENFYAGAIIDTGVMYVSNEYIASHPSYFNSGVMLLNLKLIRAENLVEKLIKTKKNQKDMNLMDQNVFNVVFGNRVKIFDVKYNCLVLSLERAILKWSMPQLNALFNTNYKDFTELKNKAVIIHFSSKDKPWIYSDVAFAKLWYKYFKKSPFKNEKLRLKRLKTRTAPNFSIYLKNIFSITNDNNCHKVICFFGIKLKVKNKNKILERKINYIEERLFEEDNRINILEHNLMYKYKHHMWLYHTKKQCNNVSPILVSVIIPVYNSEKYLQKCLNSIISQTLNNIEVICVDDGSTDNSLNILKNYSDKYSNIYVRTQQHEKAGAARNKGIDIANGDYITFVDSDDYLEPEMLKKLYCIGLNNNADLVQCNVKNYCLDEKFAERVSEFTQYYSLVSTDKIKVDIGFDNFLKMRTGPVAKLYKKSIIDKYNIRFPENLIQEDEAFYWYFMTKIEEYYSVNEELYNRLIHEESIMYRRDIDLEGIEEQLIICRLIFEHLKHWNLLDIYEEKFYSYYKNVIARIREKVAFSDDYSEKIEKIIKNNEKYGLCQVFSTY